MIERATEPKIVLLVRLLNAIDEGRHSFEQLKARIAENGKLPSTRSLRRYLAVLSEAGFPWYFDRSTSTYRFAEGYSLKRLDLSNGELFGLVALRSFGVSIGGTIGASIDEITERLVGTAGRGAKARIDAPSPMAFRLPETKMDDRGERAFSLLSAAERSSRSVQFVYDDKEGVQTTRTVDPYGFIVSSGRIYCVAYDHARKDMRTFAIDNVGDVTVLAKTFTKPHDFNVEQYAATSISGVLHGGSATDVRVRFDARVAKAAVAARVVADRKIENHDDGTVAISYRVADADELVRWVLGWGAQAEILEPANVRTRAAQLVGQIAARYN
jgi:predicted DNA-binding transcriptional regulator YafY